MLLLLLANKLTNGNLAPFSGLKFWQWSNLSPRLRDVISQLLGDRYFRRLVRLNHNFHFHQKKYIYRGSVLF